jgi:hypothetical protein
VRKVAENRGVLRQEYLLEYFMVRKWGVFIGVFLWWSFEEYLLEYFCGMEL